jgi:parallel beta-helix repeat protein
MNKHVLFFLSAVFTSAVLAACTTAAPRSSEAAVSPDYEPLEPQGTGNIYYVSGTGDDGNTGRSTTQAFRTLQRAADLTQPGDTVFAMNGVYTSPANTTTLDIRTSGTPGNWIRYRAYPGHTPKLQLASNWSGIGVSGASYILVEGFTVQGNAASITLEEAQREQNNLNNPRTISNCIGVANHFQVPSQRPHHIVIRGNTVLDCPGGGIYSNYADYLQIEDNVVARNAFYSPYGNSGISVYQNCDIDTVTGVKIIIRRNITYKNENKIPFYFLNPSDPSQRFLTDGNGIIVDDTRNTQQFAGQPCGPNPYRGTTLVENNVSYDNGGRGIHVFSSDNVLVRYNTVYQNSRSSAPGLCCDLTASEASNVRFYSNIVVSRSDRNATNASNVTSNIRFANNLYFGSTGNPNLTTSDIVANPQFVNAGAADFRLNASSPALDAGKTSSPAVDLRKSPRPQGNAPDLGAYEAATTLPSRSALTTLQAGLFSQQSGGAVKYATPSGSAVGYLDDGDWVGYTQLDFGTGVSLFRARVAVPPDQAGKRLEVRLDSPTGKLLGTLTVVSTGGWDTFVQQSVAVTGASGVHNLYLVARGGYGVANLASFEFVR